MLNNKVSIEFFELDGIRYRTYSTPVVVRQNDSMRYYVDKVDDEGYPIPKSYLVRNVTDWAMFQLKDGAREGRADDECECFDCSSLHELTEESYNRHWERIRAQRDKFRKDFEESFASWSKELPYNPDFEF